MKPHRDFGRAAALLRQSAFQGFAPAQTRLAMPHPSGEGLPVDRVEACAWLLAAAQGESDAVAMVAEVWAEPSDAEREPARDRAHRDRQGPR